MKKSNILLTGIFLLTILSLVLISATSMTTPTAGTNVSTTLPIALTVTTNGVNNMTNVTCYYNSSGGPANTFLVEILNTTAGQTSFSSSPSITSLTKTLTYNISCNVYNRTFLNSTFSAYPIAIYTSNPSCSFQVNRVSADWNDLIGITTTDTSTKDSLATLTYAWTLTNPTGTTLKSYTTQNPVFHGSDLSQKGALTINLVLTDSLGNSATCTPKTVIIKSKDGTVSIATNTFVTSSFLQDNTSLIIIIFIVAFVVIIAVVGFFLISSTKKKRRR